VVTILLTSINQAFADGGYECVYDIHTINPKKVWAENSVKVAYVKLRTPFKVENSSYYTALTQ
jgi:hypothetical protein